LGYVTLYRKWRPQTFEDVVGQEHIVRTLTNALKDNRVAHAYIFSGPRGTGKTSIAKILAKSLNCVEGPTITPCNKCASCLEITAGTGLDVIEIDAASNRGIDEIRDIREKVKFMPAGGGTKVYIIDEVHMLTPEAFNALLKMLEEPPSHVVFILATTEPHKVLQTILSRCQRFDFRRLKTDELAGRLREIAKAEGIDIDEESIALIAKQARGGMRDAVSTLDQLSSYTGNLIKAEDVMAMLGMVDTGLLFRITDYIRDKDAAGALVFVNEIVEAGWDLRQFSKDLTEHFRNLFVIKNTAKPADAVNATTDELAKLKGQADGFAPEVLTSIIETMSALNNDMRYAADPRLLLELALVKMTAKPVVSSEVASSEPVAPPRNDVKRDLPQAQRTGLKEPENPERATSSRGSEPSAGHRGNSQKPTPIQATGNEIDTIKRAWPAIKEAVKKKKMSAFANLLESRPIAVENNMVILEFNANGAAHKGRIESEANKTLVEGIIRDITGKPYVIKCVMGDNVAEPEPIQEPIASHEPRAASRDAETKQEAENAPSPLRGEDKGEGAARKTESVSAEIAASAKNQPPRNDGTTRPGASDEATFQKTSAPLDDREALNKLAGFFDATIVETKERKDET
jgi:DNA polymerase III subunit gamma/tau